MGRLKFRLPDDAPASALAKVVRLARLKFKLVSRAVVLGITVEPPSLKSNWIESKPLLTRRGASVIFEGVKLKTTDSTNPTTFPELWDGGSFSEIRFISVW
jgi:hypothetical protein